MLESAVASIAPGVAPTGVDDGRPSGVFPRFASASEAPATRRSARRVAAGE
jgi:hypothetical protein